MGLEEHREHMRHKTTRIYIRLGVRLRTLLLRGRDLATDDVLAHVILLRQVEELADLGGPLRAEALGQDVLRQAGNLVLALLDDHKREDSDIGANDAATDRFALALTGTADTIARVTIAEEEPDTVGDEDALLHRETLLVISASDTEAISLPFVT